MLQFIVSLILSLPQHRQEIDSDPQKYRPSKCPHPQCGRAGGLWLHGHYKRQVRGKAKRDCEHERAQGEEILVPRFRCRYCRQTCSSLPSCVPPRRWYIWEVQAAVLALLLEGGSLNECARQFLPSRRTARRWWRWLEARHALFADRLRSRWPDLGRAAGWRELWERCMAMQPLSEAMAELARQGVAVP